MTASAKLEAKGKLISVANFYGSYTKTELSTYFTSLEKVIKQKPAVTTPISFILCTPNHTITVGYDPKEQTWIFFDANRVAVKKCKSSEEIADCVSQVSLQVGYPEYTPLSTRAFALGRDTDPSVLSWEAKLKNWQNSDNFKNIHEVTKDSPKYDSWIQIKQAHRDDPPPISESLANLMTSVNFPGGTPVINITSLLEKKVNDEKSSVDRTDE